jgi:hypothetical protein
MAFELKITVLCAHNIAVIKDVYWIRVLYMKLYKMSTIVKKTGHIGGVMVIG